MYKYEEKKISLERDLTIDNSIKAKRLFPTQGML